MNCPKTELKQSLNFEYIKMKLKIYFFICILLVGFSTTFSQNKKITYDFFGGKIAKNETVFYRLLFQIDNGIVSGYAFTDEQGEHETKSIIQGTFNAKNNSIRFSETKKLMAKSRQKKNELCYLDGIVSLELNKNISKINGTFIEITMTGKKCQRGEIKTISLDSYFDLKKEIEKEKLVENKELEKIDKLILPNFVSEEKITIKDDEEVTIFWNSDTFKLDIWDDAKEDNDRVTIRFNEEIILDNHILKNKKESIEYPLIEGENILVFTANNTGLIANNTARVDLFDNDLKHQIITQLKLNKSVTVYLVRN